MRERTIYIIEKDYQRLEAFIHAAKMFGWYDRYELAGLEGELENCHIVCSRDMPSNVVTLHSQIRVRDLDSNQERTSILVFPGSENLSGSRISIASPVGTAILGYAVGDVIEWKVLACAQKIRIEEVIHQPEAYGLLQKERRLI